ncbi:hypothetical protein AX769_14210 [Frondihabitans sp. PAMC 28766]|uniref:DUF4870 domain-containing protein n=1 Tax=Frondihabitans sp. PAMC 28766 TaxID=1795630 RepID=UPI00078B61D6|nr:DUF4870 domain-containing protein [Frondihabitans sp. PAMC 28766]AMM21078.1 hypothetical protein AX769_14210 [Frondihabitans sp. PAMC 28766]
MTGDYNPQPLRPDQERLWATLTHVGGIFFGFLAPLVGYFVLRDRGPFIKEHTRVALNFQLTMLIGHFLGVVLLAVPFLGNFVTFAVFVITIIFSIVAALAARRGQYYRYPLSIEFVKN